MKQIFLLFFFIAGLGICNSQAQILKKLQQRVVDRAENVIVEKTAQKAADKTSDAMDKILNPNFGAMGKGSGKKVDVSNLPASYNFHYKYSIKVSSNQGEVQFDYYLNKTEPYMGVKMGTGVDMTFVFDEGNKVVFSSMNGMKSASEMALLTDDEDDLDAYNDYKITELPNKTFLGYDCIGRQMENDDYKFIVYIAPNMETSFGKMFRSDQANMPPAAQKLSKDYENGLMMFMDMTDKKSKKKKNASGTMECVAFEPVNMSISTR